MDLQTELEYLYSQEQNVELSSFWDAGWKLKLGDTTNGFTDTRAFDSLVEVADYLRQRRITSKPAKDYSKCVVCGKEKPPQPPGPPDPPRWWADGWYCWTHRHLQPRSPMHG